jgi:hypothetical protein
MSKNDEFDDGKIFKITRRNRENYSNFTIYNKHFNNNKHEITNIISNILCTTKKNNLNARLNSSGMYSPDLISSLSKNVTEINRSPNFANRYLTNINSSSSSVLKEEFLSLTTENRIQSSRDGYSNPLSSKDNEENHLVDYFIPCINCGNLISYFNTGI